MPEEKAKEEFEEDPVIIGGKNERKKEVAELKQQVKSPIKQSPPKNAYKPEIKPLIDEKLWSQPTRGKRQAEIIAERVEGAIDNKVNNLIEEVLVHYSNIDKKLYKDVNAINKDIKNSKNSSLKDSKPTVPDLGLDSKK